MSSKARRLPVRSPGQTGVNDYSLVRSNRITRVTAWLDKDQNPFVVFDVDGGMLRLKIPAGNAFTTYLNIWEELADLADRPDGEWNLMGSGIPSHQVMALRRSRRFP